MERAIKSALETLNTEDLLAEAVRDLVKDEIKRYVRKKLDENPQIREEMIEAIRDLVEAKVRETAALIRLAKSGAELGLASVPQDVRQRLGDEIVSLIEREMGQLIEKI